jgi:hypothetical protein
MLDELSRFQVNSPSKENEKALDKKLVQKQGITKKDLYQW